MADLDGVNLADLVRGLPDAFDRTKSSLDSLLGPVANIVDGFTDLKSSLELVSKGLTILAAGLTAVASAGIEAESAVLRQTAAIRASSDGTAQLAAELQDYNDTLERTLNISDEEIAAIQTRAASMGVAAERQAVFTRNVLALASVTGNVASATKALAQAEEGRFTSVSKLVGPVSSLADLEIKLQVARETLAATADSTAGKIEGISLAWDRNLEVLGLQLINTETFKNTLDDFRVVLDFTEAAVSGFFKVFNENKDTFLTLISVTNPAIGLLRLQAEGIRFVWRELLTLEQVEQQVDETEEELAENDTKRRVRRLQIADQFREIERQEAEARRIAAEAAKKAADEREGLLQAGEQAEADALEDRNQLIASIRRLGLESDIEINEASTLELERFLAAKVARFNREADERQQHQARMLALEDDYRAATAETQRRANAQEIQENEVHFQQLVASFNQRQLLIDSQSRALESGIENMLGGAAEALGQFVVSLGTDEPENAAKGLAASVLRILGSFAVTMGNLIISSGIAAQQLANPYTAIPAGLALVAVGAGVLAASQALQSDLSSSPPPATFSGASAGGTGSSPRAPTIDGNGQGPPAGGGGPTHLTVIFGQGAIVGGDGRAVGRDVLNLIESAQPSWRRTP